jgi:hypothetical protein
VGRLIITAAALLALAVPTSAAALPYLSIGNARHELERRFEREEERGIGSGNDELLNCYRVSSTHVNCYSAEHWSSERCELWLWRVWETASQREHARHEFTMRTKGHPYGECPTAE